MSNFNPRSPRGERLASGEMNVASYYISIHAPRVGSDASSDVLWVRGGQISIHAPRVGSDGHVGAFLLSA